MKSLGEVTTADFCGDFVRNERDIDQILALNVSEYGPESPSPSTDVVATRTDFIWRRDRNPAGKGIVPVIRNTEGDVAGFLWLIPLRIRIRNQNYIAATGANMVIHPKARRTFAYVKLVRKFNEAIRDADIPLHFSFVSDDNYRRLRRARPRRAFTVPLLVKPLNFRSLAQAYLSRKWQGAIAGNLGWLVSPLFATKLFFYRRTDIDIETLEHFDESFDAFWRRVQDKYPAMIIRDRAFLTWRFAPISGRRYGVLIAHTRGEMLGYAVVRCAKVRGIQTGLILDLLVLDGPDGMQAGLRLIAQAETFFRRNEMSIMTAVMAAGTAEYRILRRCGCRTLAPLIALRSFRFAFFVHHSQLECLSSLSDRDWFVTLGDFESL